MTTPGNDTRTLASKLVWPGMVFWLIGLSLTIGAVTLTLAIRTNAAVEDNYYAKAVAWDDIAAERAASAALGWVARVTLSDELDAMGQRAVTVTVADKNGDPVDATASPAYTFHHAARDRSREFRLVEVAPGRWSAGARMDRGGLWQVRMRFERGTDTFIPVVNVLTGGSATSEER